MNRRLGLAVQYSANGHIQLQSVLLCTECRLIARSIKKTWACNTQIETTTASINPTSHSLEHFVSFAGVAIQQKCTHLHFVGLCDWMQPCKRCMVWCWKSSYYIACIERASKCMVWCFWFWLNDACHCYQTSCMGCQTLQYTPLHVFVVMLTYFCECVRLQQTHPPW